MRIKSIVLKHGFYENREDSFVMSSNDWLVVVIRSTTFNRLFVSTTNYHLRAVFFSEATLLGVTENKTLVLNRLSRRRYMGIKKTYTKATNKRLEYELLENSSYNEPQKRVKRFYKTTHNEKPFPLLWEWLMIMIVSEDLSKISHSFKNRI